MINMPKTLGVSLAKDENQVSREKPTSPVQVWVRGSGRGGAGRHGKVHFHIDKKLALGCSVKNRFAERIYSQSKGAFGGRFKKNNVFCILCFFQKSLRGKH